MTTRAAEPRADSLSNLISSSLFHFFSLSKVVFILRFHKRTEILRLTRPSSSSTTRTAAISIFYLSRQGPKLDSKSSNSRRDPSTTSYHPSTHLPNPKHQLPTFKFHGLSFNLLIHSSSQRWVSQFLWRSHWDDEIKVGNGQLAQEANSDSFIQFEKYESIRIDSWILIMRMIESRINPRRIRLSAMEASASN